MTYRYLYDVGPQPVSGSTGYSECWCAPPPGRVFAASYDAIGRVVVMAEGEPPDAVRPQPDQGWGCEPEAESGTSGNGHG